MAGTKHSIQATNERVEVLEIQTGALASSSSTEPAQLPASSSEKTK
jgi:hypothetical protein